MVTVPVLYRHLKTQCLQRRLAGNLTVICISPSTEWSRIANFLPPSSETRIQEYNVTGISMVLQYNHIISVSSVSSCLSLLLTRIRHICIISSSSNPDTHPGPCCFLQTNPWLLSTGSCMCESIIRSNIITLR